MLKAALPWGSANTVIVLNDENTIAIKSTNTVIRFIKLLKMFTSFPNFFPPLQNILLQGKVYLYDYT